MQGGILVSTELNETLMADTFSANVTGLECVVGFYGLIELHDAGGCYRVVYNVDDV